MFMASRYTTELEGGIELRFRTACGECAYGKQIFEEATQQSEEYFDSRFICCGKVACKMDIPFQYLASNETDYLFVETTKDVDSDYEEKFNSDSAKVFNKDLDKYKHSIDLANEFAKHFDSHAAVGVASTWVHPRMGERTNQGNDVFYNSSIMFGSPWLAAVVFHIVSFYLIYMY